MKRKHAAAALAILLLCGVASGNIWKGSPTAPQRELNLIPQATAPVCDAAGEGKLYSDTSHALCFCDGSAWQKVTGAGTCE